MATITIAGSLTEKGFVEARPLPANAVDPATQKLLAPVVVSASPSFTISVPYVDGVAWKVRGTNAVGHAGSQVLLTGSHSALKLWVPTAPAVGGGGGNGGGGGAAPDLTGYLKTADAEPRLAKGEKALAVLSGASTDLGGSDADDFSYRLHLLNQRSDSNGAAVEALEKSAKQTDTRLTEAEKEVKRLGGSIATLGNMANLAQTQATQARTQVIQLQAKVDALPGLLVLGKDDPVPPNTPAGTVIVRKEA